MAVNPLETNKNRALHLCAALFFIASPLLIMLILSALAGQNMFLAKPYLNDEVDYWRVMYSVKECGLNFGPTGGLPGRNAPIGPLESHGLGPLAAWLWYALCFPFTESALVIASFVMLTLALLLFYLIVKPSDKQAILMAAFILCFPPLVRYINLSMMEIPCYAAVIVYIALLFRYEKSRSLSCLVLLLLSGLYCSLLRLSNVVLFFPAILIFCDNRWSWKLLWCLLAYVLGVLLLNSFVNLFIAPYPDFVSSLSECASWKEVLLTLLRNLLGLGSLMAFPGSMLGALLCGLIYYKTKNLPVTLIGEVFGTGVLGGLCAYPVAILLMGKSASDIAFYAYIVPFLISTVAGSILAGVLIYALKKAGALDRMCATLER